MVVKLQNVRLCDAAHCIHKGIQMSTIEEEGCISHRDGEGMSTKAEVEASCRKLDSVILVCTDPVCCEIGHRGVHAICGGHGCMVLRRQSDRHTVKRPKICIAS